MGFLIALQYAVTGAMAYLCWIGWRRWAGLPRAAKWLVVSIWLSTAGAVVMWAMVQHNRPTRVPQEIVLLLDTVLITMGFAAWQPNPTAARTFRWLAATYVGLFLAVFLVEGWSGPVSTVSSPVGHVLKTGVAAWTIIARVQRTVEEWTRELWFWCGIAIMLIFGTEVVLDPTWQSLLGVRNDLIAWTFAFHLVAALVGYLLMARAIGRLCRSPSRPFALG